MFFKSIVNLFERKTQKISNHPVEYDYHKQSIQNIEETFHTSITQGLDVDKAREIIVRDGKNIIKSKKKCIILKLLSYLFTGFCGLLWVAAIICILAWKPIGDLSPPNDPTNLGLGILLIIVILFQAIFSAFQDWSSSRVMNSIRKLMPNSAIVIRSGQEFKIPIDSVVLGDLVCLSYGNKVPADIRIIESHDLKFDRSMLTGESEPIEGSVDCTDDKYLESKNIAYMTTLITNGKGKGIVVAVGDKTYMGKIANLTNGTNEKQGSLQKEIHRFVVIISILAILAMVLLVIVWAAFIRVHYPKFIDLPSLMVRSISLIVGFIPSGLPVAVTLSLVLMAKKMSRNRVLVKNLTTLETLSCVNVIASDKTGTLTQNKMFVSRAVAGSIELDLTSTYDTRTESFKTFISVCCLCNEAKFLEEESSENVSLYQRKAKGDATDIAILRFAAKHVENVEALRRNYACLLDIPFNSKNKWMMKMVNLIETDVDSIVLKGAPDKLLIKCNHILEADGSETELNQLMKLNLIKIQNDWCMLGQRVLLICKKNITHLEADNLKQMTSTSLENYVNNSDDFCLVGMVGIIDPPREGIYDVIQTCRGAGIRVLMVTGDYLLTAAAIAKKIGIFSNLEMVDTLDCMREKNKLIDLSLKPEKNIQNYSLLLNGSDVDYLMDKDWRSITKYKEIVFARTTPEQKLLIVNEFQKDGYIVGVTGDGVNDAPALKKADIGIAMGSGSEVAMEASQMILLDNSFGAILTAIENGRLVFDNLRKVILYLLCAGSMGETIPVFSNAFLGIPLPLSPFQMIAICVLTDICPALSLMLEKPEKKLLTQPPRSKNNHLVDWKLMFQAFLLIGLIETIFSHAIFIWYLEWHGNFQLSDILLVYDKWKDGYKGHTIEQLNELVFTGQTITFASLVIMQSFGNLFSTRTNFRSFFQRLPFKKPYRNLWLFCGAFVSIILLILIIFIPFINNLFNTRSIPAQFFFIPLVFAAIIFFIDELRKFSIRKNILCFKKFSW